VKASAKPVTTRPERAPDLSRAKPRKPVTPERSLAERALDEESRDALLLGPSLLDLCMASGADESERHLVSEPTRRRTPRALHAARGPSPRPLRRGSISPTRTHASTTSRAGQPIHDAVGPSLAPVRRRGHPQARGPPSALAANLDDAWSEVIRGPMQTLPHRVELERRFGRDLGHLRVFCHSGARSLLDRLGARGAVRDGHILLRSSTREPGTLIHEVVHALQPRASASTGPSLVVAAGHAAEREADRATREMLSFGRLRTPLRASLGRGAIALRRPAEDLDTPPVVITPKPRVDKTKKAAAKLERKRAIRTKVDAVLPKPKAKAKQRPKAEDEAKPEAEPKPEAEAEAELVDDAAKKEEEAKDKPKKGGLPPSTVNRAKDLKRLAEKSQTSWAEGAKTADEYQVDPASKAAVGEDHHPFARGPPFEPPEISEEPMPTDNPARESVPGEDREAAEESVFATMRQIVRRQRALERAADDGNEAVRQQKAKEVNDTVETEFAKESITTLATPTLVLEGDDEATRETAARKVMTDALTSNQTLEHTRSNEDYGETVLGPKVDPTLGHDVDLDKLDMPNVDVLARAPDELLARVATDDNVGTVAIDDLLLVEDEGFEAAEATLPMHAEARKQIDAELHTGTRTFEAMSKQAVSERDGRFRTVEAGVGELRGQWRTAVDERVELRQTEAKTFSDEKVAHATGLRTAAETDAKTTVDTANTDAEDQWEDARGKADHKAEESQSKSWWERGLDWVASAIKKLTKWLADFIRAVKDAIDSMLEAARELAHDIVDAARDAIVATFDVMRAGLDFLAENLPGELGVIARDARDSAYVYLDGAQAELDEWADGLHKDIDDTIDDLRESVDSTLDGLADAIETSGEMVADLLTMGLMPWLHKYFPEVAQLVEDGLIAPVKWAAKTLEGWLDTVLESTGLAKVKRAIEGVEDDEDLCMGKTVEEREADCKAFERLLESLLDRFDRLLKHPIALRIKAYLQKQRDAEAEKQVDSVSNFFDFLGSIAKPIAKWWDKITSAIGSIVDVLKKVAGTIWRQLADALGIDPDLDPIEALKAGIQAMWETAVEAVQPIVDAIKDGWTWLTEKSPLAGIIDFFSRLPELWTELGKLWEKVKTGVGDWLATAADWLRDTFIPPIEAVLGTLGQALHSVVDTLAEWGTGLLEVFDGLLAWTSGWEVIDFLAEVLKLLIRPIRFAVKVFCDCVLKALRWVADGIKNLLGYLRTFLDICVGIATAILLGPIGIAAFMAGAIWLYLVPHCYKGPILNFLLDVAIKFIEFFPEPADFVLAAIYQGALSFLKTIRKAPDETKVAAVDLVASIFAGNIEVLAGIAVGLVEGVWEATGGTIIFLLEIVAWLISLPFKLIGWAADVISGKSDESDPEAEEGPEAEGGEAASGEAAEETEAPQAAVPEPVEQEVEEAVDVAHPARGPPEAEAAVTQEPARAEPVEAEAAEASEEAETEEVESESEEAEEEEDEEEEESEGEVEEDEAEATDDDTQEQESAPIHADADEDAAAPRVEPVEVAGPEGTTTTVEKPPEGPQELPQLSDILSKLVNEGFTKEEIRGLVDSMRGQLAGFVGGLAEQAAKSLLEALTAKGSAYKIGRVIGMVVGMVVVEVVLAYFTAGASAVLSAAKTALSGVKLAGRLGQAFMKIKKAIEPLLKLLSKLKKTVQALVGRVQKWIDDVVAWIKGIFKRKPKIRGPPKVKGAPVKAKPPVRKGAPKPKRKPAAKPKQKGAPKKKGKKKKKKGKKKKKKKKKEKLSLVARRAAQAGWRRAKARASRKVIQESVMAHALATTKVKHKPGVHVRIAIDFQGPHGWRVKATASRGARRASARSPRGWSAKDEQMKTWLAAARNQEPVHRKAAKHIEKSLDTRARTIVAGEPEPKAIAKQLEPTIRSAERSPTPKLLDGVNLRVDEKNVQEVVHSTKHREALRYQCKISPNASVFPLEVIAVNQRMSQAETRDSNHYLARTAAPRMPALTPYVIDPNQTFKSPTAVPVLKFRPPQSWDYPNAATGKRRWAACDSKTDYAPESYDWDAARNRLVRAAKRNQLTVDRRVSNAMNYVVSPALYAATGAQPVVKAITDHDGGRTPRPCGSLLVEDRRDPSSHTREKHVIRRGSGDIEHPRDLAMRAVFKKIIKPAGVKHLGGAATASAFNDTAEGNTALERIYGSLQKSWTKSRDGLVHAGPPFHSITLTVPRLTVGVTAFTKSGSHPWPAAVPWYVYHSFQPAYRGNKALYDAERTSTKWREFVKGHAANPVSATNPTGVPAPDTTTSMTTPAVGLTNIKAHVRADPRFNGFFFVTVFPST
jgi:hypothetical protein